MSWTRTKRWIGTHPIRAIVPVHLLVLAGYLLYRQLATPGYLRSSWPHELAVSMYVPLAFAVLLGWTCFVGCVLGRAGLRVERRSTAAFWMSVTGTLLALPIWHLVWNGPFGPWWLLAVPYASVTTGLIAAFPSTVGTVIGLALAEAITRRMVRRGKWEVTVPPWAEDDLPPLPPPSTEEDSP